MDYNLLFFFTIVAALLINDRMMLNLANRVNNHLSRNLLTITVHGSLSVILYWGGLTVIRGSFGTIWGMPSIALCYAGIHGYKAIRAAICFNKKESNNES